MPVLTNTWKRRVNAGGRGAGRIILSALVVSAAINGIGMLWRVVFPSDAPPIAGIARTTINQSDLAKAFAIDCVTTYLTASSAQGTDLSRCFPDTTKMPIPTTPALIVSAPVAYATIQGSARQDFTTYGVIVGITEQTYPTSTPRRAYYQIPISVYANAGPRALDNLARVDGPPPGADVALDYPVTISAGNPLSTMLSGFITSYLTKTPGLERFVTTDSGLRPLSAYASATLTAAQAASSPPDNPADNTELAVRVTVSARSAEYTPYDLSYPLTLRASGGSWFVAAIDPVPLLADTTPAPQPSAAPSP